MLHLHLAQFGLETVLFRSTISLRHFGFERERAYAAQIWVTTTGVLEPVDDLEDRRLGVAPSISFLSPDQLRLQRFGECLDSRVVATLSLAALRWMQAIDQQLLW
jgi:hypothetical protein